MEKKELELGNIFFIAGYHILLCIFLPIYIIRHGFPATFFTLSMILAYIAGIAITGGYHRLFSHQTYKTNRTIEYIMLFFGTLATQGSALKWACDHRRHHAFIDSDQDPYSIKKGFWHAHVLWMFRKGDPIDPKIVPDLLKKPHVVFQHRYYVPLMFLGNIGLTLFFGALLHNYFASFVFIFLVRLFTLHHFTWFINSLAHLWGTQNYSKEHSAVDNYILCLLTFGEGYHNYHHTFTNDYRNGIKWYHYDPTKWLIWTLSKVGLAYDLKKATEEVIWRRLIEEHKKELKARINQSIFEKKELWNSYLDERSAALQKRVAELQEVAKSYKKYSKEKRKQLQKEITLLKKSLKEEWRSWNALISCLNQTLKAQHNLQVIHGT